MTLKHKLSSIYTRFMYIKHQQRRHEAQVKIMYSRVHLSCLVNTDCRKRATFSSTGRNVPTFKQKYTLFTVLTLHLFSCLAMGKFTHSGVPYHKTVFPDGIYFVFYLYEISPHFRVWHTSLHF